MKKLFMLVLLMFSGCLCYPYAIERNETPSTTTIQNMITTTTEKSVILRTTTTATLKVESIKVFKYVYQNKTLDMSKLQETELMNLRPQKPGSPSFSAGFDECKRLALDILNLKKSEFRERESYRYSWDPGFFNDNVCLTLENDGFKEYFDLPTDNWYISSFNTSFIRVKRV